MSINIGVVGGAGSNGTTNLGGRVDGNFFVKSAKEHWYYLDTEEGLAIGVGGQLDYQTSDKGNRVRPLVEANIGYAFDAGPLGQNSFKGFVQKDLDNNDTYVGARLTKGCLSAVAVSFQVARNLRDKSWHVGGGVGKPF